MKNKHIMIVDDHASFRTGMKMILTQFGQDSGICVSLLLVDYRLRDNITGKNAIQKIRRELNQHTPAIIITRGHSHRQNHGGAIC